MSAVVVLPGCRLSVAPLVPASSRLRAKKSTLTSIPEGLPAAAVDAASYAMLRQLLLLPLWGSNCAPGRCAEQGAQRPRCRPP